MYSLPSRGMLIITTSERVTKSIGVEESIAKGECVLVRCPDFRGGFSNYSVVLISA